MELSRSRYVKKQQTQSGPVLYWMSRDQRVLDNWALIEAAKLSKNSHLEVVFALKPHKLSQRIENFMLTGLNEVHRDLLRLNIPFHFVWGDPVTEVPKLADRIQASAIVCDMSPLKNHKQWVQVITKQIDCSLIQVDAHNIVPIWTSSPKQEWAAYTFRPKINRLLPEWLTPYPKLTPQNYSGHFPKFPKFSPHPLSGRSLAEKALEKFIANIKKYNDRNNPNVDSQSGMSAYLHFGQISPATVAARVIDLKPSIAGSAFLEEVVVRRELADNYCWYNQNYDNFSGFPDWSQKTLNAHRRDKREYIYTLENFEYSQTHDALWNAAQTEMVKVGKMHGYMRMYWAKKILEWSPDAQTAQKIAIYLNDKYEYDGRDPNGYTGIAWSVGGVHDRPWFDRPVIGTIRPMTAQGLAKKFDTKAYVTKINSL